MRQLKSLKILKKNSAQKRQSLYLAKLLRAIDFQKAQRFVDQLKFESQTEIKKAFHQGRGLAR